MEITANEQPGEIENTKSLISKFNDTMVGIFKKNEETGVVKFLKTTVSVLEVVVKKIDKYLKSKDIDVKEQLQNLSAKGNQGVSKARSVLKSAKDTVSEKGMVGGARSIFSDIKTRIKNAYDGDDETSGAPPPEQVDPQTGEAVPTEPTAPTPPQQKGSWLKRTVTSATDKAKTLNQKYVAPTINKGVARVNRFIEENSDTAVAAQPTTTVPETTASVVPVANTTPPAGKGFLGKVMGKVVSAKDKALTTATSLYSTALNQPNLLQTVKDKAVDISGKVTEIASKTSGQVSTGITQLKNLVAPTSAPAVESQVEKTIEEVTEKPAEKSSFLEGLQQVVSDFTDAVKQFTLKTQQSSDPAKTGTLSYNDDTAGTPEVTSSKSKSSDDYKDALRKADERADKRKREVEEEKKAVKEKMDAKNKAKGGSWLSKILKGITSLGGFLVGGIGKIIKLSTIGLAKLVGKSAFWALTKIVPSLTTSIARGMQSLAGSAAKAGLRGAWGLAKGAVMKGAPLLWAGAKGLATGLAGAIGTTGMVVAGGVLVAAAAIYGGYKLYKYLNRNNIDKDIFGQLTRVRLLMYGFNDAKKESYHKLLDLEMLMKDYIYVKSGQVYFTRIDNSVREKVRDLFGVKADEREKMQILNTWFTQRFLPSFKMFADALMPMAPNIYLDTIDKLSKDQVFVLASKLTPPPRIYDITQVPTFDSPQTTVSKQEVDDMIASIVAQAKENSKLMSGKSPEKTKQELDKKNQKTNQDAEAKAQEVTKAAVSKMESTAAKANDLAKQGPSSQQDQRNSMNRLSGVNLYGGNKPPEPPNQEAEPPVKNDLPKAVEEQNKIPTSGANTAPPVATGEIKPADPNLQGVAFNKSSGHERLQQIHPKVFSLFTGMANEFNEITGKKVVVNESFRTYQDQVRMKQKYGSGAAKPGSSIHEFGMAIDINSKEANLLDEMGLMRKYGFTRPIGAETWHLEPAGVAINPQAAKADPEKREEAIDSSPGRGGGGFGTVPGSRKGGRNTKLQEQIYASAASKPVDTGEVVAKLKEAPSYQPPKDTSQNTPTDTSTSGTPTPNTTAQVFTTPSDAAPTPRAKPTPVAGFPQGNYAENATKSGGYASSVSKTATNNALQRSGVNTSPPMSLESTATASNNNLDVGQVTDKITSPVQAIKKASNVVGMNPDTMVTFAKLESSLDPNAGANTSSAKGLFQIVGKTWREELLPKYGPKYNVPPNADIFDPYYNSLMGISYAKQNASGAIPAGQRVGLSDVTSLYLAHHFGPTGSKKIIDAFASNPDQPMQNVVSQDAYNANRAALQGKTVRSYIQSLDGKIQTAANTSDSAYKGVKSSQTGAGTSSATKPSTGGSDASGGETAVTPRNSPTSEVKNFQDTSGLYKPKEPKPLAESTPVQTRSVFEDPTTPSTRMERTEIASTPKEKSVAIPQQSVVASNLPPQPSLTQNLNPSNEILTNQLNVLVDIKNILENISKQSQYPTPQRESTPPLKKLTQAEEPSTLAQTPQDQRRQGANLPTGSKNAISLSRRILI